ncbi:MULTISPECIES: methylmalonyl-CoA mutase family protein [Pelosinus]|uniref:methylmalonyl-CoA mutase family protein n=2 Tax=Sporomusaceae TaxID=1843490 RepID=UPI001EDA2FCF|nr:MULTISPECIES: methylmalonyl-CoA mutase family protein [Pelosinus]
MWIEYKLSVSLNGPLNEKLENDNEMDGESMSNQNVENKETGHEEPPARFFAEFPYPTYEEWRAESEKALKGANWEKKLITKTYEGINLQPMYRIEDLEGLTHCESLPGSFPFVRGSNAMGYLDKPWEISQECAEPFAVKMHEVLQNELNKGGTTIHVVADKATLNGIDGDKADDAYLGKGISLSTLDDVQQTFHSFDLEKTPLLIFAGTSGMQLLSLFAALMKANGSDYHQLKGCIGVDPIGYLATVGELAYSLDTYYDEMAATANWAHDNTKQLRTILVQGHPYHNSGANAVQELAFVLATGVEYLQKMQQRGAAIDVAAKQIVFSFSVGTNFFMEIAKLRAGRMLWAQIVEAFGGTQEAQKMYIHARTSAFTKSVYDPYVNMLRTTTEAFSAIVGGVDSLHVGYFDEAVRPADDFSHRIARNTQIMLQQECNLTQPVDPAGGSWYIEKLTSEVAEKTWSLFQEVEAAGGIVEALQQNLPQEQVGITAKSKADGLAKRKDVILGTNMYPNLLEKPLEVPVFDARIFKEQRKNQINDYRLDIDDVECKSRLEEVEQSSLKGTAEKSLLEAAITAVLSGATLGDITHVIRKNQNVTSFNPLNIHSADEQYRQLRQRTESYIERTGKNVEVFLVNMGEIPQHKARADFVSGFLEVGAFTMLKNNGFATVEEAAKAALESGATIAVICSTDATYPELVSPLAKLIKEGNPNITLFLAGLPPDDLQLVYKEAGVDDFIHVRANCYKMLAKLQKDRGIV